MELAGKEECSLGYSKLTYEEYIENPEVYLRVVYWRRSGRMNFMAKVIKVYVQ